MQKFSDRLKATSELSKPSIFDNKGRFDSNVVKRIDFDSGPKSKNLEEYYFTNFYGNENESAYCLIKELYSFCCNGDFEFLNELKISELRKSDRIDRLLKILSEIQDKKYSEKDLFSIYKTRYKNHDELRIYIKRSRNNLSVILLDLYHLGIYSAIYKKDKMEVVPLKKLYRRHIRNTLKLDDLKSDSLIL